MYGETRGPHPGRRSRGNQRRDAFGARARRSASHHRKWHAASGDSPSCRTRAAQDFRMHSAASRRPDRYPRSTPILPRTRPRPLNTILNRSARRHGIDPRFQCLVPYSTSRQKVGTKNTLDRFLFYGRLYLWTLWWGPSCLARWRPAPLTAGPRGRGYGCG